MGAAVFLRLCHLAHKPRPPTTASRRGMPTPSPTPSPMAVSLLVPLLVPEDDEVAVICVVVGDD